MSLPLDSVRAAVDREWARFRGLLGTAGWSVPTRLPGWAVSDLAVHAVWGVSMEADALRRRRTGGDGRAAGRTLPAGTPPETVRADLAAACAELHQELDRLTEGDLASTVPLPYGDVPLGVFSQILVMEAGVHTSDLAAAAGEADDLGPDVVAATALTLRLFLPGLAAAAGERPAAGTAIAVCGETVDLGFRYHGGGWEATSGPAGSVATITGDDSTVLLFALGRIPGTDGRLSIAGDRDAGLRFKRWLPGP